MSSLSVTLIDVGWGDSILIETADDSGDPRFALVDCNDTTSYRSSFIFVKRFLERKEIVLGTDRRIFDFVLLTHGHSDHASGIQGMMSYFRTDWFWYPKSVEHGGFAKIIKYANKYPSRVRRHQAIDNTKFLPNLGGVKLRALWPPFNGPNPHDSSNENNNSIVLELTLGQVSLILTGDCEADNWSQIVNKLPPSLALFQVPHHGAVNGVFDNQGDTPWLNVLSADVKIAMSSHIRPHHHPAPQVEQELTNRNINPFRTDQHYHLTFTTNGTLDGNGNPDIVAYWSHP